MPVLQPKVKKLAVDIDGFFYYNEINGGERLSVLSTKNLSNNSMAKVIKKTPNWGSF